MKRIKTTTIRKDKQNFLKDQAPKINKNSNRTRNNSPVWTIEIGDCKVNCVNAKSKEIINGNVCQR